MKRLFTVIIALACVAAAFAQTPEEILSRMEEEMEKHMDEGLIMTISTKVPVVGTVTMKNYSLGNKTRSESKLMGTDVVVFTDGETEWTYYSKTNKVKIERIGSTGSSEGGDEEMFSDISDGYDLTLTKETDDAWYLTCKKSKTNQDKDMPKTIELVIAKGTYYPKLLKAKVSGITFSMRDVSFGVSEDYVTFRLSDYPGVTVEDERNKK